LITDTGRTARPHAQSAQRIRMNSDGFDDRVGMSRGDIAVHLIVHLRRLIAVAVGGLQQNLVQRQR
jgi:hypothetical protein